MADAAAHTTFIAKDALLDILFTVFKIILAISLVLLTGCRKDPSPITAAEASSVSRQQLEQIRLDLDKGIPPPSKNAYLNIHNMDDWENPSITVQENMLSIHVLMADANPTDYGKGTMIRPIAARKQEMTVRAGDLAVALNAIPRSAWPYGRVIAVEEARNAPASIRPQVRRNMEKAMQTLNELGIVINEWNEPGSTSIR